MDNQKLNIQAKLQILKPIREVFEAIVDPAQMANYFISESTSRMEAGKELIWRFPEFDMDVPVRVGEIKQDDLVSFYWDNEGKEFLVEMKMAAAGDDATVVTITEKSANGNQGGIEWLKRNTEGWANFLACLKAYLEYGINLRKGAFDFMKAGQSD